MKEPPPQIIVGVVGVHNRSSLVLPSRRPEVKEQLMLNVLWQIFALLIKDLFETAVEDLEI